MALTLHDITVDADDPRSLAEWWAEALGWVVCEEQEDDPDIEIRSEPDSRPRILFQRVPESKTVKNRIHLDLAPGAAPGEQDAEVERLLAMGATRADIGQGDESWVVLADPEGNELCVLGRRHPDDA